MDIEAPARLGSLEDSIPLSAAQREVWREHALYPLSAMHTIGARTDIHGDFDAKVFERSLEWIWHRHDALRLAPIPGPEGDEPRQCEVSQPDSMLHQHDVSSESDPNAAADKLALELGRQSIPLDGGATFRFHLIRVAADRHVWVMCYHHINMDAWANGILVRDAAFAYRAFSAGRAPDLPVAPSYRDQADRDATFLAGARGSVNRAYWLKLHLEQPERIFESAKGVFEWCCAAIDDIASHCGRW